MKKHLFSLFSLLPLALAACLGDDPDGDGGDDITHAAGRWQLNWECEQGPEHLTGCDIGELSELGKNSAGQTQFSARWPDVQGSGILRANALSVTYQYGRTGSPDTVIEEAIYTFDRADQDLFRKTSTYAGNGVSGSCVGAARRIPAEQTECVPLN